jgi:hypothetical protein
MADDEKVLRIETHLVEDGNGPRDNESTPEYFARRDREWSERMQREGYTRTGPGTWDRTPPTAVGSSGSGGPPPYIPGVTAPPRPTTGPYAAGAATAAGVAGPPPPPTPPAAAVGAAAGGAARGATAVTAAGVGSAFLTIAATVTVVVAALAALSAVVVTVTAALNALYMRLVEDFLEFSPEASIAQAEQDIALTQQRIDLSSRVGNDAASVIGIQTRLYEQTAELRASISELIYPILERLLFAAEKIMAGVNWIVDWLEFFEEKWVQAELAVVTAANNIATQFGFKNLFSSLQKFLEKQLANMDEEEQSKKNPYYNQVIEFLSGKGQGVRDFYRDVKIKGPDGKQVHAVFGGASYRAGVRRGRP